MNIDTSQLLTFISPAIFIGVLAYLTKFFGRIISDQRSFADDRKWQVEVDGVMFIFNFSYGVIGIALALHTPQISHWISFGIISFFITASLFAVKKISSEFFEIENKPVIRIKKGEWGESIKQTNKVMTTIGQKMPLLISVIVLFYVGTNEYLSGNILWMIFILPSIFLEFILLAFIYSLNKVKPVKADVYLFDQTLKNVTLLKINEDNIRVRQDNKIILLNKNSALRVEITIPENELQKPTAQLG